MPRNDILMHLLFTKFQICEYHTNRQCVAVMVKRLHFDSHLLVHEEPLYPYFFQFGVDDIEYTSLDWGGFSAFHGQNFINI